MFARRSRTISRAALAAVCAAGLVAVATGCSTGPSAALLSPSVSGSQARGASAGTSPSAPARLTMTQARTEYEKISAPFNAAVAKINQDAKQGTTWSTFHADLLAAVSANQAWAREIKARRWPLQVQSLIDSMLKTEVPAEISCDQKMAESGSLQGAANVFSSEATCKDSPATADKVRKILNLPATIG